MVQPLIILLQANLYAESAAARYSAATTGMFILIIAIGVIGFLVQARLQSVFKRYSKVQFPGGLTGAEVAEKMLRDNNIHNVKVTHVGGHLTDHFNPQTMTVNLSDAVYSSTSVAAAAVAIQPRSQRSASQRMSAAMPYSTPAATPRWCFARSSCPWCSSPRRPPRGSSSSGW